MSNLFSLHNYYGLSHTKTLLFSGLLVIIFSIYFPLFFYRFIRDVKILRNSDRTVMKITERLEVKDRIFGWVVAMIMLSFVLTGAIAGLRS